jgi:hypothetical protein
MFRCDLNMRHFVLFYKQRLKCFLITYVNQLQERPVTIYWPLSTVPPPSTLKNSALFHGVYFCFSNTRIYCSYALQQGICHTDVRWLWKLKYKLTIARSFVATYEFISFRNYDTVGRGVPPLLRKVLQVTACVFTFGSCRKLFSVTQLIC